KIASRNLPKRRARRILTITAVFLGVALLIGLNMATSSALGEFNNYINKFWGATDIVVTSGNGLQFSNQTLNTVENNVLVHQTADRLVWEGVITHIYASLYDSTKTIQAVNELQTVLPTYDVSAQKAEAVQRIQGQTTGFQIGLNVMIGLSLVVCTFILSNALYMTVSERTYE